MSVDQPYTKKAAKARRDAKAGAAMRDRDRDGKVDRLLHDAEHAKSGARFARMLIGRIASAADDAKDLDEKVARLVAEANRLDPDHAAPAWKEADV